MTTIVVGYVAKPEGEAALASGIAEAQLRQAKLVLVHATRNPEPDAGVEEAARLLEQSGVTFESKVRTNAFDPAEDLLAIADEVKADLIVIGLRRRTPVGKLLLGSSAQRILLDAHPPVLAVKVD